ncbi:MAG: hypothetical protein MJB14_19975 [Spirochaetes bacterium]|nr:hypothetical protein [Spirochaetota bacterium]
MNFKVSALITVVFSFLILIINILNNNSFILILIRLVISGALIFGIITLVQFLFTSVVKIDLSDSESKISESESTVNYVVDDNTTANFDEPNQGENALAENKLDNIDMGHESDTTVDQEEATSISGSESDYAVDDVEDMADDVPSSTEGYDESDIVDNSQDNYMENRPDINAEGTTIKDKLGVNATPEEIAKAIKTKLNEDK